MKCKLHYDIHVTFTGEQVNAKKCNIITESDYCKRRQGQGRRRPKPIVIVLSLRHHASKSDDETRLNLEISMASGEKSPESMGKMVRVLMPGRDARSDFGES